MEAELQAYLDSYEATHDYDEYVFDLDEISHDPYVLLSLLTALKGGEWTLDEVQSDLKMLFERQYILTEDVTTETRCDENGEPYEYTTVTVTLENFDLSHLPVYLFDRGQALHVLAVHGDARQPARPVPPATCHRLTRRRITR